MVSPALQSLLAGVLDYAGLFPPATLSMQDAVAAYSSDRCSSHAWLLGRFVVPAARLSELAAEALSHVDARDEAPWPIAMVAGPAVDEDVAAMLQFNAQHAGRLRIDVVESRTPTPHVVTRSARAVGDSATLYAEVPIDADPLELLVAVRESGARAKVRTGGLVPDAFPTVRDLARFIARCAELGLAWKATAGLHHPLRASRRLTYQDDAPRGTMFGFLNVFAAGVFANTGLDEASLAALLDERSADSFRFDAREIRWRDHAITLDQIVNARSTFAIAFGSCSFREPVDDLHQLGLL